MTGSSQVQDGPTPSEIIERAAALLVESEIFAVEVNNPPESSFRELWPVEVGPLVELLRQSTGMWRLYEGRGMDERALRVSVGGAAWAALELAKKVAAVPAEVAAAYEKGARRG